MLRRWLNQAGEIQRLTDELEFRTRQLTFTEARAIAAEERNVRLDKKVESERDKRDKFIYVAMDRLSIKSGQFGAFEKALVPKVKEPAPTYSPEIEMQIMAAAEINRQADIDAEIEPLDVEMYAAAIRKDPERYLPR